MKIKISDVAKMLQVSEQCVRIGLQRNIFDFGVAIKSNSKYKYVIYPEPLKKAVGEEIFKKYCSKN